MKKVLIGLALLLGLVGGCRRKSDLRTQDPDRQHAIAAVRVVMYSTSWCGVCKAARRWLSAQGIPYEDYDVERDPSARDRQRAINSRGGVPTFEIDGEMVRGFNAPQLTAAIARAADRHTGGR